MRSRSTIASRYSSPKHRYGSALQRRGYAPSGAVGLMQIMPETWSGLRFRYGLGADPFDPHDNIVAGAAYLREFHDRYCDPGFLAAYNAGPARVAKRTARLPLPDETRAYISLLAPLTTADRAGDGGVFGVALRSWTEAPLFVMHADGSPTASRPSSEVHYERRSAVAAVIDLTVSHRHPAACSSQRLVGIRRHERGCFRAWRRVFGRGFGCDTRKRWEPPNGRQDKRDPPPVGYVSVCTSICGLRVVVWVVLGLTGVGSPRQRLVSSG